MRLRTFQILIFILCCCLSSFGQQYKVLEKADSLAQANDYAASIKLINEVLDSKPRNFLKAQAYYQLSYAYLQVYDLDRAYDYNQKSLDLRDRLHYEFIADNYMRFGTIELLKDNYKMALDYFLEAKELPHQDLRFSGILDGYLGATYERLGDREKALVAYTNSLEILEWELSDTDPDVVVAHYNLGNYYASIEDYKQAIFHYDKSVLIELQMDWGTKNGNPRLARAYNALGLVIFKEEIDVDDAKSNFRGAILASKGYRRLTAVSRLNLAQIFFIERNFNAAAKEVEMALSELDLGGEEDPQYFIPMITDKKLYIRGLELKTKILLEKYSEGQTTDDLIKAFESSTLAVDVFEGIFLNDYHEKSQLNLVQNSKDIYEEAIYIGLKLYYTTSEEKYKDEAFKYTERGKAIVLKNQMQQLRGLLAADLSEGIKEEEKRIRMQLAFFATDWAVKYKADNFRKENLKLYRDYKKLQENIRKSAPKYYDLRYHLPAVSIAKVQEEIESDEAVLSYYQGEDLYYVFAINKLTCKAFYAMQNTPLSSKLKMGYFRGAKKSGINIALPSKKKKKKKKKKKTDIPKPDVGIYTQYTEADMDLKTGVDMGVKGMIKLSKSQFVSANHSLYLRLIEPVKEVIKRKRKLIIIPHGDLHFVTFETLLKSKPKAKKKIRYNKLKYLIRDYAVSYEMAADFLLAKKDTVENTLNAIAAFAPVFNPSDNIGYTLNAEDLSFDTLVQEGMEMRSAVPGHSSFKTLKHSEDEVINILELFADQKQEGKAFLKQDATEAAFKKEAGNYQYLHLASHSFVNTLTPKLSGVALTPADEEDGILFAGEVMNLDLQKTALVVLSSCESGTGGLIRGEGLLSLNRAFLFAGAENTISTRWKVTDKQSAQIMASFYKKILGGASNAEALRSAKLRMIKRSKTATPRLWAGFVLTGR